MRYLAGEASRSESKQQTTRPGPELGQDIVMDECDILDLTVETFDERELGFGPAISLALVIHILWDLLFQYLGGFGIVQDAILSERKKLLEEELANREAD